MEDEQVVEQNVEPTPDVTESTPVEPDEASPSQAQEPASEPALPEAEAPKEKPRSAQGRIRELVAEKKALQSELERTRQSFEASANTELPDELTPEQYRALTFDAAQVKAELEALKQEQVASRLEADTARIYTEFPDLSGNKVLDEKLSKQWYEDYAVVDNSGNITGYRKSPLQFVKEQMDLLNAAKKEVTQSSVKAMERQMAESPVTPETTAKPTPKDAKDMSIKELESKLGVTRL